jgi:hypothetical protein
MLRALRDWLGGRRRVPDAGRQALQAWCAQRQLGFEPGDLESWAAMESADPKTGATVQVPITETDAGFKALLDELPIRQSILRTWFMANAGDKARRKN